MAAPLALFAPFRRGRQRAAGGSTVPPPPSAPAMPNTPFPIDTGVARRSVLSWVSAGAAKVDLYLDTVTPPVALAVPGHYVGTSYTPTLRPATTYYWQIVAINDGGTATGPIWSFTTPRATDALFELDGAVLIPDFMDSLTVRETLSASPNEAALQLRLTTPDGGASIRIGLGSLDDDDLIFGGEIQALDNLYVGTPANNLYPVTLIDQTFRINKRRPVGTWLNTSASIIGRYLVAVFAPGFTANHIQDDLPAVSINFDLSADFMSCLGMLATAISSLKGIGRARVDYSGDVHLFIGTEGLPQVIDMDHRPLNGPPITFSVDHSQLRTRVYGKGAGSTVPCDVLAGETILPLADGAFFEAVGGQAIAATISGGAQTEILDYAGVQPSGGGSLVGPGAAPSVAPTLALAAGTGLGAGVYKYVYSDVTTGESLVSPLATITTGTLPAPASAPLLATQVGLGLAIGSYQYAYSDITAAGETLLSPLASVVTTGIAPPTAPSITTTGNSGAGLTIGTTYRWLVTFVVAGVETGAGAQSGGYTAVNSTPPGFGSSAADISNIPLGPVGTTARKLYRTLSNGTTFFFRDTIANNTSTAYGNEGATDSFISGNANPPPTPNHTQVVLTALTPGPAGTIARKVYRTVVGGAQLKFLTTIADNTTTTWTDAAADGTLGVNAPTTNTASAAQVTLTAIALGASPTSARKIYRTAVGGAQLKLLTTLADNTTTTFLDTLADGSLGANAPTSDTSGLTQPPGQVNAGSITVPTASPGPFQLNGGWVLLSGGQWVRYTGITGNTLTGVPASGPGAITTTVLYGTPALPAPALTGLNQWNGLTRALAKGSAINLWVQRDDLDAQQALGALELDDNGNPTDGIREYLVVDERRTDSLIALCDSNLAVFSRPIVSTVYAIQRKTHAGDTVSINLLDAGDPWGLVGDFTVQSVDLAFTTGIPTWRIKASSVSFTLSELLRRAVIG